MDLFEEKFLANSMNRLTKQQWQEILLKIEETFPLTPPHTWAQGAQVQSKVHKMWMKFNQLKQEHGESDAGQCKWPWFERCLMIWGKTWPHKKWHSIFRRHLCHLLRRPLRHIISFFITP
jgi:hypothetical protein